MNRATLYGNVGGDPEIKTLNNGDKVSSFSLATSEKWTDKATGEKKESTEWHRIVCFNQGLVGVVERFVNKGSKLLIEGQIKTRKWQDQAGADRYSTEIVIGRFTGSITLAGSPSGGAQRDENSYGTTTTRQAPQGQGGASPGLAGAAATGSRPPQGPPIDDDIPF